MYKLDGKIIIVTGATSGIGESCAKVFAEKGAIVVLVGRNNERGAAIQAEIREKGFDCFFIACDVTKEDQVIALFKQTIDRFGKVDVLFNNAGMFPASVEIERLDYESWKDTFDVNINAYFLVTKYAKPYLLKTRGSIINNASIAGMHSYAMGRSYAYSAAKAAVIQFTRMMAKNYAEEGIRVNSISPGIIWTPMMHDRDPKQYIDRIPMKRVGTAEDVSSVVLFLVSDAAGYITGINIPIDGGASL